MACSGTALPFTDLSVQNTYSEDKNDENLALRIADRISSKLVPLLVVPWLRRLVTVNVQVRVRARVSLCGLVMDKVALGQVSLQVLGFSSVNIILPQLFTLICYLGDEI
jgi:hypothetical protein